MVVSLQIMLTVCRWKNYELSASSGKRFEDGEKEINHGDKHMVEEEFAK